MAKLRPLQVQLVEVPTCSCSFCSFSIQNLPLNHQKLLSISETYQAAHCNCTDEKQKRMDFHLALILIEVYLLLHLYQCIPLPFSLLAPRKGLCIKALDFCLPDCILNQIWCNWCKLQSGTAPDASVPLRFPLAGHSIFSQLPRPN